MNAKRFDDMRDVLYMIKKIWTKDYKKTLGELLFGIITYDDLMYKTDKEIHAKLLAYYKKMPKENV